MERREMINQQKLNNERLRFYTNITHELRTPLTLIIGPLGDLMDDTKLPLSYTRKINLIHRSALHLLELVNQILDFRKVESQNRKLIVAKSSFT
jgi:signal transduction histidine kinase